MNLLPRIAARCLASLCVSFATCSSVKADIVFDSHSPTITLSGYSSGNAGTAIQLDIATDTTINGISILNQMPESGNLRFLIYSEPDYALLLLTPPKLFDAEMLVGQPWVPGTLTWKNSDSIDFTLKAGKKYVIGYVRDVSVYESGDSNAESINGITSDLVMHCINGFESPTYSHRCFTGTDFGVRLLAVPEASTSTLFFLGLGALALGHRKRKHSAHKQSKGIA